MPLNPEMHMLFHDLSMSPDKELAIKGRLTKAIVPAFLEWMEAEDGRPDSLPSDIVNSTTSILALILTSAIMRYSVTDKRPDALAEVLKLLTSRSFDCLAHIHYEGRSPSANRNST